MNNKLIVEVDYFENGQIKEERFLNREDEQPDVIMYYDDGNVEEEKWYDMPISSIAYYLNGDVSAVCKNDKWSYYEPGEFNVQLFNASFEEDKIILRRAL